MVKVELAERHYQLVWTIFRYNILETGGYHKFLKLSTLT